MNTLYVSIIGPTLWGNGWISCYLVHNRIVLGPSGHMYNHGLCIRSSGSHVDNYSFRMSECRGGPRNLSSEGPLYTNIKVLEGPYMKITLRFLKL